MSGASHVCFGGGDWCAMNDDVIHSLVLQATRLLYTRRSYLPEYSVYNEDLI